MFAKLFSQPLMIGATARAFCLGLALFALLSFVGCGEGGQPASLSGTVNFDNQPVPRGAIRLIPKEGTPGDGGGAAITEGSYSIPAGETLKAGPHTVRITAMRGTGQMVKVEGEMVDGEFAAGGERQEEMEQYIPDKYNASTELTVDLAPGENSKDFDLEPE